MLVFNIPQGASSSEFHNCERLTGRKGLGPLARNRLTQRSEVIDSHLVTKFADFYATEKFIVVFKNVPIQSHFSPVQSCSIYLKDRIF
jgi:hypothetical protein